MKRGNRMANLSSRKALNTAREPVSRRGITDPKRTFVSLVMETLDGDLEGMIAVWE